jgi:HK97 gp10 family phage protein
MAARRGGRLRGLMGMNNLRRIMGKMPPEIAQETKALVLEMATKVEATARANALSGDMASQRYARSISKKISRAGFSAKVGVRTNTEQKRAWFAHFIEWGTAAGTREWKGQAAKWRKMRRETGSFKHPGTPARPVLLPAFEAHRAEFMPRITRAIQTALQRLAAMNTGDD